MAVERDFANANLSEKYTIFGQKKLDVLPEIYYSFVAVYNVLNLWARLCELFILVFPVRFNNFRLIQKLEHLAALIDFSKRDGRS